MRRIANDLRNRINLSDVVARRTKVTKLGTRYAKALCVFHTERSPSLTIHDDKGFFHCFGCGAHGDVIDFVMRAQGLGFIEALQWLGATDLPEVNEVDRVKAAEEDAAEREAAIAEARAIWKAASPAEGTPAAVYARSRGITSPLPPSIRFARTYAWRDRETGEVGPDIPALIGAVIGENDRLVGIQRIFLRDGGAAKASMRKPKLSLGRVKGGALRLGPAAEEVIVCEGPEDGLTLMQELPGSSVWVALGTAMMPEVHYPEIVRRVVIAGQNDAAGSAAVEAAALKLVEKGFDVRTMYPDPAFKDWNDQLRGLRR